MIDKGTIDQKKKAAIALAEEVDEEVQHNILKLKESNTKLKDHTQSLRNTLVGLQSDIDTNHDKKVNHINQLKLSIEELNAINNTRKIQRSNFTIMGMGKYYTFSYLSLAILICVIVFWVLISKEMKSDNATFDNLNIGLITGVVIIIIFGFLMVNAFWGINVRRQMNKVSSLYKFPQY
jgi:hypothetical protein